MGRVRRNIRIDGRDCWTLFDPGALNSYVVPDCVGKMPRWNLPRPESVGVGEKRHRISSECRLVADVEGHAVRIVARIVERLGNDEEKKRIEVLFGALAMEEWGINVDTKNRKLDFKHYRREFVEFTAQQSRNQNNRRDAENAEKSYSSNSDSSSALSASLR